MDPITLLLLLAVTGWVAAAPDRATLAASRGAAAATVSAVRAGWSTGRTASAARRAAAPPRPAAARGNWISGRPAPSARSAAGTRPAGRPAAAGSSTSTSTRPSTTSKGAKAGAKGKGGKAGRATGTSSTSTSSTTGTTTADTADSAADTAPDTASGHASGAGAPRVVWPTARAAAGAARAGWVQGVSRARAARAAGTDPTSRIVRAARRAAPVVGAGVVSARTAGLSGVRAWRLTAGHAGRRRRLALALRVAVAGGALAWRTLRQPAPTAPDTADTATSGTSGTDTTGTSTTGTSTDEGAGGPGVPGPRAPQGPTGPTSPAGDPITATPTDGGQWLVVGEVLSVTDYLPHTSTTTTTTAGTTTTSTSTTSTATTAGTTTTNEETGMDIAITATELASLGDLRAEVEQARASLAALSEVAGVLPEWAAGLAERYSAAGFQTSRLTGSVAMVAELGAGLDLTAWCDGVLEGLAVTEAAVAEAEQLGELASSIDATGDVDGFLPA